MTSRTLKVVVAGGGIAGQATAFWLARSGHEVVVVERHPVLRATGAQVDLRGQGIEAIAGMGLLDAVRDARVHEPGVAFVDGRGRRWGTVPVNTSGTGRQTVTSEYEIMRGDLVRILHGATNDDVRHVFGAGVESVEQDGQGVRVRLSDGSVEQADVLIGADGQGSRVRRAVLPAGAPDPYRPVGIHMAYWFVPRDATDGDLRETYNAPGGRMIMRRSHGPAQTQVYLSLWEHSAQATAVHRESVERQQEFWAARFGDAGWQTERFLAGMRTSEFFYSQEVTQVRIPSWSAGRVALVGDAAYCPSPYSGMGTSAGLVGAYVLAGEIDESPGDLAAAFARYETTLRPFVATVQAQVDPLILRLGFPRSRFGTGTLRAVGAVACLLRIPELAARFAKRDRGGDWQLPEYPRLRPAPAG